MEEDIALNRSIEDLIHFKIKASQMWMFVSWCSLFTPNLKNQFKDDLDFFSKITKMSHQELDNQYDARYKRYQVILEAIANHPNPLSLLEFIVRTDSDHQRLATKTGDHKLYFARDLLNALKHKPDFNINKLMENGETLLDLAQNLPERDQRLEMIKMLQEFGAKTTNELRTNIDLAQNPRIRKWKFFIDNYNRIFDSNFDRNSYAPEAPDKKFKKAYYSAVAIITFLRWLVLPILATVYVFSRLTLIVLNPQAYKHNPAKAGLMLGTTLMAAGALVGLALDTSFFSAQTMMSIAGSVGGGAAVIGLVGMVAFATLLHLAKTVAQQINKREIAGSAVFITAPKHHIHKTSNSTYSDEDKISAVNQYHDAILLDYYSHIKKPPLLSDSFEAAAAKRVLYAFEQVAQAKKSNTLTQDTMGALVDELKKTERNIFTKNSPIVNANNALAGATVVDGKVKLKVVGA